MLVRPKGIEELDRSFFCLYQLASHTSLHINVTKKFNIKTKIQKSLSMHRKKKLKCFKNSFPLLWQCVEHGISQHIQYINICLC